MAAQMENTVNLMIDCCSHIARTVVITNGDLSGVSQKLKERR